MMRKNCYVYAWGCWFSMVHRWEREPDIESLYRRAVAEIVQQVQPGVIVVEVSA
jgi:hypothetical protein